MKTLGERYIESAAREFALRNAMKVQTANAPAHFSEDWRPTGSPALRIKPIPAAIPPWPCTPHAPRSIAIAPKPSNTADQRPPGNQKQWPLNYPPNLPYGQHPGDRICPHGQSQKLCYCETCAYWARRYGPREG